MKIGVSTASLYPLHVEDAFAVLAELGVKTAEVFPNATVEAREPILSKIEEIREKNDMTITSFHPFSSPMESVFLFSAYDRRIEEMMTLYEEFFAAMNKIGAKIFVLHGAILSRKCTVGHYLEQFRLLSDVAKRYKVTVAQENVNYCMSGDIEFLKIMKRELGEQAKFVLDLKQARRSGKDPLEFVSELKDSIIHCHISDANAESDCLPIGDGDYDFTKFTKALFSNGYDGAFIIELYRDNYGEFGDLRRCVDTMSEIVDKLK